MSGPERRTTRATLGALSPREQQALHARAAGYAHPLMSDTEVFVTETMRVRKPLPGMRDKAVLRTTLVASPVFVLVLVVDKGSMTVLHAPTEQLSESPAPERGADLAVARLVDELRGEGIEMAGLAPAAERGVNANTFFLGLGAPDGGAARAALTEVLPATRVDG